MTNELRNVCKEAVNSKDSSGRRRFNMRLVEENLAANRAKDMLMTLATLMPQERDQKRVLRALIRRSFFIELVNHPKIGTTLFRVRWFEDEGQMFGPQDPRFADFDTCCEIFDKLSSELMGRIDQGSDVEILGLYSTTLVSYESPIDYVERTSPIHTPENIAWFWNSSISTGLKLRNFLLSSTAKASLGINLHKFMTGKLGVKVYLTDRVITGSHKTNREKRWEVHPNSVHFALYRTCVDIECTLLSQLISFRGVPQDLLRQLTSRGLISVIPTQTEPLRCPITRDVLDWTELVAEVSNPQHGRARFQVGHMDPLKSDDTNAKHEPSNISWISADGNRIQGSLSLTEVRSLLNRISENYRSHPP